MANGGYSFSGGMPLQDVQGIGMLIRGTDAHGNYMEFHGYLELSTEVAE